MDRAIEAEGMGALSDAVANLAKAAEISWEFLEAAETDEDRARFRRDTDSLIKEAEQLKATLPPSPKPTDSKAAKSHAENESSPRASVSEWEMSTRPDLTLSDVVGLND